MAVEKSKTEKGKRTIPLNASALDVLIEMHHRAQSLEGAQPDHYVFPSCEHGHFDPTKPQKTWRTSWRRLTKEAGLKGLRFHDLRHHAITELAESLASDQVIQSIAGHMSRRMLDHYSHIRMDAKRNALDALVGQPDKQQSEEPAEKSYVTIHVTNSGSEELANLQLIET
jgi:integrase